MMYSALLKTQFVNHAIIAVKIVLKILFYVQVVMELKIENQFRIIKVNALARKDIFLKIKILFVRPATILVLLAMIMDFLIA